MTTPTRSPFAVSDHTALQPDADPARTAILGAALRAGADASHNGTNPAEAAAEVAITAWEDTRRHFFAAVEGREAIARDLDAARRRTATIVAEADAFREQVREVAIRVADEQGWCHTGLNEVLAELNLPAHEREFDVEVRVTLEHVVTVRVKAADSDAATALVMDGQVDEDVERSWDDATSNAFGRTDSVRYDVEDTTEV